MRAERDVTPTVRTWLRDGVTSLPDHVLDRVLDQVPAIRQERSGLAALRNQSMRTPLKVALAAAAIIVVTVAGLSLMPRNGTGVGGPVSPEPKASSSASPTPARTIMRPSGTDTPQFTVVLPPEWAIFTDIPGQPGFSAIRGTTQPTRGMSVYFYVPTTTYADPCNEVPVSPPVGPTVDDFVQSLREIPNISTTEPTSATLGGLPATYLEMTTDDTLPCAPNEFYIWDGNWTQGPGQIVRTWVLEVNGSRVVASALRYPEATQEMLAEQQSILDSLQFE